MGEEERILAQAVAGRLMRGVPVVGGTLALTATRLVFVPLISREGIALSNKAAKLGERAHRAAGSDDHMNPQRLLNALIKPLAANVVIDLLDVQAVTPSRRCAVLVEWRRGDAAKRAEFAIAASRFSPSWNPRNVEARDRMLTEISRQLP